MMRLSFPKLIALCLVIALVVVGCQIYNNMFTMKYVPFSEMEYVRPDVRQLDQVTDRCLELAEQGQDVEDLMEEVYNFYDLYSGFYTNFYLCYIHYCIDTTDIYWSDEYTYCSELTSTVDAAFDELMHGLAASPLRSELEDDAYFGEGYFDDHDGESLWTEDFTALMEQQTQLENEYYEIVSQASAVTAFSEEYYDTYGSQMAEIYVELVALRQKIAQEAGYDSYPEFAYDFIYGRDYTPDQVADYLEDIQQLVPLYRELNDSDIWLTMSQSCSTDQTYEYVAQMAAHMGGSIQEAFEFMDELELSHIAYSQNKLGTSFEVYLPDYYEPFVFVDPTGSVMDQLTFAHEFGHFCNDYVSYGAAASIDVAEIFSQGMEYLSLCYAEDTGDLEAMKMADSLCVYVEQAAYASFELRVYALTGDELTVENVEEVFRQVGEDYGFDSWDFDSRVYLGVPHFFTDPMYVISYVVSNDAALQLYQMEQAQPGSGLACYEEHLATEHPGILSFLLEAGLESPFTEGRVTQVRETFETILS